jgi:formylglycine-generating enzyme required for sulfatase activity
MWLRNKFFLNIRRSQAMKKIIFVVFIFLVACVSPVAAPTATPLLPTVVTPIPDEPTNEKDGTMRLVPAGEFTMGSEYPYSDNDKPVHQVYLDAFYMDIYEVTNAAYKACVDAGVCTPPQETGSSTRSSYYGNSQYDNYPVVYVNWFQAQTYCEWHGGSLPTEAQWEKVASWDDETKTKHTYPWGEEISCNQANYFDGSKDCVGDTSEVGSYESGKSPYGIYDMPGNVWEWVADWYGAYPGNTVSDSDYGTQYRVLRGGGWHSYAGDLRTSNRARGDPVNFDEKVGFRCAKDAP